MITKFRVTKKKKIVCCIVDNRKACTSGWANEISVNITDFLIYQLTLFNFDIFIGDDENELLSEVNSDDYTHAVLIASGTALPLECHKLWPAIEELCKTDFYIAGHILDRNENAYWRNGYYELHHQFYIVKIADYISLGCPQIGTQSHTQHVQIAPIRSEECLYDDEEVAGWISTGTCEKSYEMKCHGWNIISNALLHNKKIIDLGPDIRNSKQYLYYEHEHSFLNHMPKIYHDQFFVNNFFISLNSDGFGSGITFDGPVEQYISVGTGVHWISYLNKIGTTADTTVVFTDINCNCLLFMKSMVDEWDGTNYAEFYRDHMPIMPNGVSHDVDTYIAYTKMEWETFVNTHENWVDIWNGVKKLKFEYRLINYMATYDLSWITPGKRTLINLSDVFTHGPYIATQSLKYRVSCENKLLNSLRDIDENMHVRMTSRAADGYYPTERMQSGPVKEFELTDINLLQKTPWHVHDWSSPIMLGTDI